MEIKRTFTQSIQAKAEDALLLEILPTKTTEHHEWVCKHTYFAGIGCSNHDQRVRFQYDSVHNGSNFPKQLSEWNVLHSTPVPEDFDAVLSKSGSFADALDINLSLSSPKDMLKYFIQAS